MEPLHKKRLTIYNDAIASSIENNYAENIFASKKIRSS